MAKRETDEITIPAVAVDAFNEAIQQVAPDKQSTPTGKIFSETDVENIRKQEKDKMYKRLEEADARTKAMEEQLNKMREQFEKTSGDTENVEDGVVKETENSETTSLDYDKVLEDSTKVDVAGFHNVTEND